jgi:Bacterial Ig-like domain (group 1)
VNIAFTETITAPTVPGPYTCTVTAVVDGTVRATQTINATVIPGPPATLTLTPATDTNPLGTQHCVIAHVVDQFGNPTPGRTVRFSVSGVGTGSGAVVTNASGNAQFCYTGPLAPVGDDTITAFADTNLNGVDDGASEPNDSAIKHWIDITPPTGSCTEGPNPAGHTSGRPEPEERPESGRLLHPARDGQRRSESADLHPRQRKLRRVRPVLRRDDDQADPGTGEVDWKIKLKGDAQLFFVDASGNVSGPVTCLVPPPPK